MNKYSPMPSSISSSPRDNHSDLLRLFMGKGLYFHVYKNMSVLQNDLSVLGITYSLPSRQGEETAPLPSFA